LRFLALDNRMHREIVEALDNRAVLDTHARLQENIRMAQLVHRRPGFRSALLTTIDEHLKVVERLEQRDTAGAVEALEEHFRASMYRTYAA
jgi:DNA-binding GntR family transcriptional regulator